MDDFAIFAGMESHPGLLFLKDLANSIISLSVIYGMHKLCRDDDIGSSKFNIFFCELGSYLNKVNVESV